MVELNWEFINYLPQAATLIADGLVRASNALALHYLPQLTPGAPLPDFFTLCTCGPNASGHFTAGPSTYCFTQTDTPDGVLIVFQPAPQTALTDLQLEASLRQLRQFMGEFLVELGPKTQGGVSPAFIKSFHRMFRLVNNLEFMRSAASPEQPPFRPGIVDLAGLCRQLVQQANTLLCETNTTLDYQSALSSLLIPGDPQLLQRMLLGLVSNCLRRAAGGGIVLTLRRQGNRAVLTLSDSAGVPTQRQLSAMLQQDTDHALPQAGDGAGLGLGVVRHIANLHKGTMLVDWGQAAHHVVLSLPLTPLPSHLGVHSPTAHKEGGLSPLLVELSDMLPVHLFALEGLD